MKTFVMGACLALTCHSAMAELKALGSEGLESFVAKIPETTQSTVHHSYRLRANFELGSQYGRLSSCRNNKPRKEQSFYPCWNHQSQIFFDKLSFALRHQEKDVVPTEFRFNLSRSGRLTDIEIFGVKDGPTKRQLINLLKDMEFGYSYKANVEPLILSVDTRRVAGN